MILNLIAPPDPPVSTPSARMRAVGACIPRRALAALVAAVFLEYAVPGSAAGHQPTRTVSQAGPSFSAMKNECALGQWGDLLIEGVVPPQPELLSQEVQRELSTLLEELRRKIWDLLNEVQSEQWKLGQLARDEHTASASLRKQYLRIQLLCGFTVDAAIATRESVHSIVEQAGARLHSGTAAGRY